MKLELKLIKTTKEYNQAVKRTEELFEKGVKKGTSEGNELEVLLVLIEKYEDEHFPIDAPDPVEAIKFRMEQMDLKPKDLEPYIGNKSMVSRVLNGKRNLSLEMIRGLNQHLHIPAEILIGPFSPAKKKKSPTASKKPAAVIAKAVRTVGKAGKSNLHNAKTVKTFKTSDEELIPHK